MLSGLYSASAGIRIAEWNQEVVAQNLANVDTPGYRRATALFEVTETPDPENPAGEPLVDISQAASAFDFSRGRFVRTDAPLDLALDGDGFFAIEGPDGPLYTKSGVFHLNADGELVNTAGLPVVGDNGPLTAPPNTSPSQIEVLADGTMRANGIPFGSLRVVRFEDTQQLVSESPTLFSSPTEPLDAEDTSVQQGYREMSNVSATDELVRMIVGMRYHQASQQALQSLSNAIEQQVSEGA